MAQRLQGVVALLGRILICVIFLNSAFGKITNPRATMDIMEKHGLPLVQIGLPAAIAAEALGGLSLLLGLRARIGAGVLFVFLIPTTLFFHNFWAYAGDAAAYRGQMTNFMKNLAILGGLLMLVAFGPGGISFDAQRAKRRAGATAVPQEYRAATGSTATRPPD